MLLALFVVLADSVLSVPSADWEGVKFVVPQPDTTVSCAYQVETPGAKVQLLLVDETQAMRLFRGRSFHSVHITRYGDSARFRARIPQAGNYVMVVDNRLEARQGVQVRLQIELSHSEFGEVYELAPEKRRGVIALSMLFFGAVVFVTATLFLRQSA